MTYSLGLDIGSISVKLAVLDENCNPIVYDFERVVSDPRRAVNTVLKRLEPQVNLDKIQHIGITGTGRACIPPEMNWPVYSNGLAIAVGILHFDKNAKTVIQIGGQSSFLVILEDGLNKPWKIVSNPLCAAGTGRFLEQQAYRLGVSIEDFAQIALQSSPNPPRIAARCSVFAKSDLIHLQQKGVQLPEMLYGLCESIARMAFSLHKGFLPEPVYFVGGVAANHAVVHAMNGLLSAKNGNNIQVKVPQNHLYIQAFGAALLSRDVNSILRTLPDTDRTKRYFQMPPLQNESLPKTNEELIINRPCSGYLGVDIGSTSTKAVIIDEEGNVLLKSYLMTAGRPIEAIKQVFRNLIKCGANNIVIKGVGATGSGRYLVGGFIGADVIKNEITAQTRAAAEIDPEADIIEIGGQDSKLVIKRNGMVVDYQMNKACAAGTGSFIDELAEMLGISVTNGDFARLAFQAPWTIDLGTRCAAFMAQSVSAAQQEGIPLEIIVASLANSIAKNYLSKVVGNRKLGKKVILTGAVFFNEAVVSAFKAQLKERVITVARHREVSGAIGAALLARETMHERTSKFKGFQEVIDSDYSLSTFTCKDCDNNCTITRMNLSNSRPAFFGSRCDKFENIIGKSAGTAFDERENLLLKGLCESSNHTITVGLPRALLFYDFAPLLINYLNHLGAKVVISGKTTRHTIEKSIELSYTDSCFPLKLAHGHMDSLSNVDYILYPSEIRLGQRDGDENQKYSCPLVQASPFIIRTALNIHSKLIIPILDFSLGNKEVVENLGKAAQQMGFNFKKGRAAALFGIEAQHEFEREVRKKGDEIIRNISHDKPGVVLIARSYMSQDSGANLGIAEKLAQLDVVPVPIDFLPISDIDPRQYSDRPYWYYESKFIAAASIIAGNPNLYGLALTNFGCGPNSFILKLVEDIMQEKPLGQIEIDEHAAEAGIVTRLEAFVDTIQGYSKSARRTFIFPESLRRNAPLASEFKKTLAIPRMAPFVDVVGALLRSRGINVEVLPDPDDGSLALANEVTSGTECLPYRITLGDFLKFCSTNNKNIADFEFIMASSYGPCRLGKYALEQGRILNSCGFDVLMRSTVSNNAYRDINVGGNIQRKAVQGVFAVDLLQKLLWRTRPYEKEPGLADKIFDKYLNLLCQNIHKDGSIKNILEEARLEFAAAVDNTLPRKPLIGINGEIFLRSNSFSNNNLIQLCEKAGLEVVVSPIGEWLKYTSYRNLEDTIRFRKLKNLITSFIKNEVIKSDERQLETLVKGMIHEPEPDISHVLAKTQEYLSTRCGSEAVLSLGTGIQWLESPHFAGVISVMPHGCMPGGIVAAFAEKLGHKYHKPWISLTYDGIRETTNETRVFEFAEIIKTGWKSNKFLHQ